MAGFSHSWIFLEKQEAYYDYFKTNDNFICAYAHWFNL